MRLQVDLVQTFTHVADPKRVVVDEYKIDVLSGKLDSFERVLVETPCLWRKLHKPLVGGEPDISVVVLGE